MQLGTEGCVFFWMIWKELGQKTDLEGVVSKFIINTYPWKPAVLAWFIWTLVSSLPDSGKCPKQRGRAENLRAPHWGVGND